MREFSTPATHPFPTHGNLTDDLVTLARERPAAVLFGRRHAGAGAVDEQADVAWAEVGAQAFLDEVRAVARGLLAAGVGVGDRVALMSRTRFEWTLLDYAIWWAGAVTVPVYATATAERLGFVLADSGAVALVVETEAHRALASQVLTDLAGPEEPSCPVWTIDAGAIDVLTRLGRNAVTVGAAADAELAARRAATGPGDLATVVYTSGSTGRPRGCPITHGMLMHELDAVLPTLQPLFEAEDAATLVFLPLAHVLARIVQIGCVRSGTRLGHSPDVTTLDVDLATFRPTFVLAVPRVFEKLFNTASQQATADGHGGAFDRAVDTAISYSRALERVERGAAARVPTTLRARHAVLSRPVRARLREALGGRCAWAVSGGAPLGERLGHLFRGVGVPVLEGYGLTESAGALTVNLPGATRIGTVGRPLPGTTVRVGEDGELLFRGAQVFDGYWADVEATAAALDADGWLHTGDVGEVDDEGFVRITGRRREILVTAGGKNVAPAVLEDRVRAHALVDQCLVVGDGQPYVAALVTLDRESLTAWAAARGKSRVVADLVDDPQLEAEIQGAVDDANRAVSQAEAIRRFRIVAEEWTEDGGQLTPSLKLRRTVVTAHSKDDIAALYAP